MRKFEIDLAERVMLTGDKSPGNWNFAADIVTICANYMEGWTNRTDDAMRIPQVLDEASHHLRQCAIEAAEDVA